MGADDGTAHGAPGASGVGRTATVAATGDAASPLEALAALVVKRGVSLGGLSDAARRLALALPASVLGAEEALTEAQVNARLKAALAEGGVACFLGTDHVELRRWLVDTGWWARDGYGRAYRRVPEALRAPPLATIAVSLGRHFPDAASMATWVARTRDDAEAVRRARRAAFDAGGGPGAAA